MAIQRSILQHKTYRVHFEIAPVRLDQLDEFCQVLQGQIDLEHGPLLVGALLSLERSGTWMSLSGTGKKAA